MLSLSWQKRPSTLAIILFCLILGTSVFTCSWFRQPFLFPQWIVIYLFTLFAIIYLFKDLIVMPKWGKWANYILLGLVLSLIVNMFIQSVPIWSQANLDRITFIVLFLTFLKLFHHYPANALWRYFCWSIIVASIIFFGIAYYEYFSGVKLYNAGSLFAASLGNINMAAEFIGISFFCQIFLLKQIKNKNIIYVFMLLLVITVVYLYFARCRSVLIGVTLGSCFLIAIKDFLSLRHSLIIAWASTAVIIMLLHFSPTRGLGLYTPDAGLKDSGFAIRWQMITDALHLFWHHPLGVGPNNYEFSIVPYQSKILYQTWAHTHIHPHSEPIRFLIEDGIAVCVFGGAFLLCLLCASWQRLCAIYREPLPAFVLSLSLYMVAEFLFEFPLTIGVSFITIAMIFAYACYRLFPTSIISASGHLLKAIPGYFIFSIFTALSCSMIYANYIDFSNNQNAWELQKGLYLMPESTYIRTQLIDHYLYAPYLSPQEIKRAESIIKEGLSYSPSNIILLNQLVYLYQRMGNLAESCYVAKKYDHWYRHKSILHPFIIKHCGHFYYPSS